MILENKTSQGLKIIFDIDEIHNYSSFLIYFEDGWRDDRLEQAGMSHLFEHLVGKRTSKYKNKSEMSAIKNKYGISSNAVTLPTSTSYHHSQIHSESLASLDLLLQSVYETEFNSDDLETEKKIVLREKENYLENKNNFEWRSITEAFFGDTTLSKEIFGTKESLQNITVEDFKNYYKAYKNPKNATLLVCVKDNKTAEDVFLNVQNYLDGNDGLTESKFEINRESVNVEKDTDMAATIIKENLSLLYCSGFKTVFLSR